MAVSLKIQSGFFIKTTPPICLSWNSQLPVFSKFSSVRPLKAATTTPISEPVVEIDTSEVTKKVRKPSSIYRPKKRINRNITTSTRVNNDPLGILKYQLITQAAMNLLEKDNTLVFIVDTKADKIMIKNAVEKMCCVKVDNVNTLIRTDMKKKAYVKLKQDQDGLDIATKIGIM